MSAGVSRRTMLRPLLESRKLCVCLAGAGLLHVGLSASGLGGWPCPFRAATGWPCPGCGLGTACAALLHGDVLAALRLHAFAPVVLAGIGLLLAGCLLRGEKRAALLAAAAKCEERTACAAVLIVAIFFYWLARLFLDGPNFLPLKS